MNRNFLEGFTLLEVLLATAIIAIALVTIVKITIEDVRATDHLLASTKAHWIALNTMNALRQNQLSAQPEMKISQFDKIWVVNTDIQESPDKRVSRVTITVRERTGPPLAILHGFKTEDA